MFGLPFWLPTQLYIASFTAYADDLSQWRAYGDSGKGVCIGFEWRQMFDALSRTHAVMAGPVIYDEADQKGVLSAVVELIAQAVDIDATRGLAEYMQYPDVSGLVNGVAPFLKHPAFADEREFRIAIRAWVPRNVVANRRRTRREHVSSTDLLGEFTLPIRSVTVGPLSKRRAEAEELASSLGATVRFSSLPLRR
jgi:hypothetical protein